MSARPIRRRNVAAALAASLAIAAVPGAAFGAPAVKSFAPLSSFNVPDGGVAEIVSASADGKTLVYTDSGAGAVGLVDISDPETPSFLETIDVGGEPTSVSVTEDDMAVVAVRRDVLEEGAPPQIVPGAMLVIDLATNAVVKEIEIGHHPDSVATGVYEGTPYAVVAIENEPVVVDGDGNLTDGEEPGDPGDISGPGLVQVVNLADGTVNDVPIALGAKYPFADDPQPEYVDLSGIRAAVSLQENNAYAILDVRRALMGKGADAVRRTFSAGKAKNRSADLADDETISFTDTYPKDVADEPFAGLRFPDGISYSANGKYVLSADEGEFDFTGGRGWSIRSRNGKLVWEDGGALERAAVKAGQYPDGRSDAKGIEVEGVEVGTYGDTEFAFVGSERGSFLAVYELRKGGAKPRFVQLLPTGVSPEGILSLPERGLVVTSNEVTGDLSIFTGVPYLYRGTQDRPEVRSKRVRTPWSAVSGLAGDTRSSRVLWGVPDNALPSELYRVAIRGTRGTITSKPITKDSERARYDLEGIVADTSIAAPAAKRAATRHRTAAKAARARDNRAAKAGKRAQAARAKRSLSFHRAKVRNHMRAGFWLAQEGNAAFGEDSYLANLLIQVDRRGRVIKEIPLPEAIDSPGGGVIRGNGFEGVTLSDDGRYLFAAIQRDYADDADVGGKRHTRIARYDLEAGTWDFFLYPLDGPVAEGWVGLSEIVNVGGDRFLVIERDQQVGGAAEVKKIYEFTLDGVEPTDGSPLPEGTTPEDAAGKVIEKTLYQEVVEEFGPFEKLEGLAITRKGDVWGNVDNDGGEHESRFLRLGPLRDTHQGTPGGPVAPSEGPDDMPLTLSLLHSNDGESDLLPNERDGGVARFATIARQAKAAAYSDVGTEGKRTEVLISAGDNILPGKELNASIANGVPFFDAIAYDLIKYDAMIIGNHDFDQGPDVLEDFIRSFRNRSLGSPATALPPFLSANLDVSKEPGLAALEADGRIASSTIAEVRGYKIGIIGATTPNLPFITTTRNVMVDIDVVGAVQREIDALKAKGVTKIILSSHLQGVDEDLALIPMLQGIDIAVAGGGDELLADAGDELLEGDVPNPERPYPIIAKDKAGKDIPVVTAPGGYDYLGRLVVKFDARGEIVEILDESGPIANFPEGSGKEAAPAADVQSQVVEPVSEAVAAVDGNVLGQAVADLDGDADAVRSGETNLGNFTADAILAKATELAPSFGTSVDIAIQNGGGIRDSVPAGDFTEGQTFDIFPFGNVTTVVEGLTPAELKEVLENAVSKVVLQPDGSILREGAGTGRFAQVAGFTFTYDPAAPERMFDADGTVTSPGSRILDVTLDDGTPLVVGGVPVGGAPSVNVAINNFNAGGGDQYPVLPDKPQVNLGAPTQTALADYLASVGSVGADGTPYAPGVNERILPLVP